MRQFIKRLIEAFEIFSFIFFGVKIPFQRLPLAKRVKVAKNEESLPCEELLYMITACRRGWRHYRFTDFAKCINYQDLPGRWQLSITDCFVEYLSPEQATEYFENYLQILKKRVEGSMIARHAADQSVRSLVVEGGYAVIIQNNDVFYNVHNLIRESSMSIELKGKFIKRVETLQLLFQDYLNDR